MNQDETMSDRAETIRELWANKRAATYKAEEAGVQSLQASSMMPIDLSDETVRSSLPRSVLEAYDYYFDQVESADWGSVSVSKEKIQNQDIFAVNVSTDGDDGWAELFDAQGQNLGAARTLLEQVAWGEPQAIRASTENADLPAELQPGPETGSNT
ncbi:hypothetical protein [Leptolyngbya sp. FACHB-17]|uniref:hypothetical protein n=1 Tax=unclassified Leptolyngbya TaxID=2650499 RepID=UPI0016816CF5|nr:hypothetical protein [Leptolyngbya sp. FACHB-17]MBD2081822.1 hypothetical protein [Leptolyngbya sp. FACHB-17]